MALTIGPAVRGAGRGRQLLAHGLGLLAGAGVMALALTLVGDLVHASSVPGGRGIEVFAGVLLALWAIRIQTGRGLPFPSSRWQVPEQWRSSLPPYVVLVLFGFLLGLGFLTSVVFPLYWVLAAGTLVAANLPLALAAWLAYAGMRLYTTALALREFDRAGSYAEVANAAPRGWKAARALCVVSLVALALLLVL